MTDPTMRPDVVDTIVRPIDRLGRAQPRRLGAPVFAGLWARIGIPVERIPGDFFVLDVSDDGITLAEISCPCGHTAHIEAGGFGPCRPDQDFDLDADQLDCPRFFAFTGEDVFVIGSPKGRELQTAAAS